MGQNALIVEHTLNQHFNFTAAGFASEQARRDHARIVEDQQVARIEFVE
jgi:hypothetical protein